MTPRVAFFTDSFHEVNGVAHTSRHLDQFARQRNFPILSVHAGPENRFEKDGLYHRLELKRSAAAVALDEGLAFDPFYLRHWRTAWEAMDAFQANVVHVTGPGDLGILGAALAWRRGLPIVASWHTNLHEYAARRLPIRGLRPSAERVSLKSLLWFYGLAQETLAPNDELRNLVTNGTRRPCHLMERGIDTELFSPSRRVRPRGDGCLRLGYVGRLRPEKNVELLLEVEKGLRSAGLTNYQFLIVGDGSQRDSLKQSLAKAEFAGVLRGKPLAEAYASMDLFLFPSWTDTYGNVVAEALASGVPALVTAGGGPKFLVRDGETGLVAESDADFVKLAVGAVKRPAMLAPMGGAARVWALSRSWERVFEDVWRCYRRALEAGLPEAPPLPRTPSRTALSKAK